MMSMSLDLVLARFLEHIRYFFCTCLTNMDIMEFVGDLHDLRNVS
ncbi:hypothetical protein Hdeb2414_s0009g00315581 [Helianthus debilis subsp. tardiflorus]